MEKIFVTGANGFIGKAVCSSLLKKGFTVHGTVRSNLYSIDGIQTVCIDDIGSDVDWRNYLNGMDVVIHLAARVHVMKENAIDPLAAFRLVNVAGTERLARMAAKVGVRRFVFLSSVGVNGNSTYERHFTEEDDPNPQNPYALSKLETEKVLHSISAESGIEVVIIRAPLVYGPANPGNFLRLLTLVDRGLPLPLALVNNLRSFIYLENLVDAIAICSNHPKAAGQTYLVSDGEDVSTPELIQGVAAALGRPARLFPFPPSLMRFAGKLFGKTDAVERLASSLTIDSSKIRRELGWKPPYTMEQGLRETGEWFKKTGEGKIGL